MCLGSRVKVPSRQLPKAAAAIPQFAWFSWAEEAPICFLAPKPKRPGTKNSIYQEGL